MNLGDAEPVENVGHERLETHIFHSSNHFRRLEVSVRSVSATLSKVVDEVPMNVFRSDISTG